VLDLVIFLQHELLDLAEVLKDKHEEVIDLESDCLVLQHVSEGLEKRFRWENTRASDVFMDEDSNELFKIFLIAEEDGFDGLFIEVSIINLESVLSSLEYLHE
jgi:hypothetical protein